MCKKGNASLPLIKQYNSHPCIHEGGRGGGRKGGRKEGRSLPLDGHRKAPFLPRV